MVEPNRRHIAAYRNHNCGVVWQRRTEHDPLRRSGNHPAPDCGATDGSITRSPGWIGVTAMSNQMGYAPVAMGAYLAAIGQAADGPDVNAMTVGGAPAATAGLRVRGSGSYGV